MKILEKIQKEFDRFIYKNFKKKYGNFISETPYFVDEIKNKWQDNYFHYHKEINEKMHSLVVNMDEESQNWCQLFLNRNIYNFPRILNKDWFMYNYDKIYTDFEKKGIREQTPTLGVKLPENYEYCKINFLYQNGLIFLSEQIKKYIENKDIIDGGAFIGDSAVVFDKLSPRKIFCFEPGEENIKDLKQTIKLNNLEHKITPVNMGLAEKTGNFKFAGEGMMFQIVPDDAKEFDFEIQVTSIDEFAEENNLNIGLIKLDVEGYEYNTILGAINTIKKYQPVLLISIYHNMKDFLEIKPMLEKEVDYKFMVRKLEPMCLNTELMLIGYPRHLDV